MKDITYTWGIGGYDPSKPNNNLVEIRVIEIPDEEIQIRDEFEPNTDEATGTFTAPIVEEETDANAQ